MFEFEERSSSSFTWSTNKGFSGIIEAFKFNPWIIHPKCEATCGSFTALSVRLHPLISSHFLRYVLWRFQLNYMGDAFSMMGEKDMQEKLTKKLCTQKNVKKTVKCLGCQVAKNKTISTFDAQDFVNGEYRSSNWISLLLTVTVYQVQWTAAKKRVSRV
jgi:hypothetical protein